MPDFVVPAYGSDHAFQISMLTKIPTGLSPVGISHLLISSHVINLRIRKDLPVSQEPVL